ncbi:acyl-CoA dehydrogenase family protein [Rhodococcus sp. OK302]|uniref:acyl-CoA dehydrogenase family protein n=1 Tax=Rhodococcus sp. OK302 TaxID=1882769 RepID=UPI000B9F4337|nr:acyl-CoA dehydrogenase family protein [Rhodococcus sp. OK302]OYD61476.1 alkylation response protein AidB-like acyl-CoA dehydrogenase [Rhodococcus sp. OK302]
MQTSPAGTVTRSTDTHGVPLGIADPVERARFVAPAIRAAAAEVESNGTMTDDVVNLLTEAELFWLLAPTEVGGGGAEITQALAVTEEISAADGSIGWSLMANMSVTGFSGGHCAETAVDTLFRGSEKAIIAGMFAPMGKVTEVEGGYRAGGRYQFGSGTGHASWIGGGARTGANNEIELIFMVPREQVEFLGNWDVLGLVGTGSYDYEIPQQFVSTDFTVQRTGAKPLRGQSTQHLGLQIMGSSGHAGVALGIARRAFGELHGILAAGKSRPGVLPIIEQQLFQHDFAVMEGKLASARAFCFDVFDAAQQSVNAGNEVSDLEYQRVRQASTFVTGVAREAVEFAYAWSGSKGLRGPNALARCVRDIHGATQHVYVDPTTMVSAAPSVFASYAEH